MTELLDMLTKVFGVVGAGSTIYLLLRKAPAELRSGKINTEEKSFGLYTQALNELAERDEAFSKLRERLTLESKRADDQEDSIKQLRRESNTQTDEIARLKADLNKSNTDADDFKSKWEEERTESKRLAREIRILRRVMTRNGSLTPEIEAEIAASLDLPSGSTPPEGTPSVAPVQVRDVPEVPPVVPEAIDAAESSLKDAGKAMKPTVDGDAADKPAA